MMNRLTASLAALALFASGCATTSSTTTSVVGTPVVQPAPAPAFNPTGKWSLGIVAQGQAMEVVMDLAKLADGNWSATLSTAAFPPMQATKTTLTGKQLMLSFPVPTGDMGQMTLNFDGASLVEGEWSMPGDGGKVSGKKM